jgi:hypothetical protein
MKKPPIFKNCLQVVGTSQFEAEPNSVLNARQDGPNPVN